MKQPKISLSKFIFSFGLSLIILFSCTKEEIPQPDMETDPVETTKGVFICNEGNFMYGNASLSFYNSNSKNVENQVFFKTNNAPLGDVCQSMNILDGKGFIVINNSGKIQVIDTSSFEYTGTISGLNSPRYIEKAGKNKYYVTDLYSSSISIIDPSTLKKTGEIKVGHSTEMMAKKDNYIYTSSWSFSNKVYKIDTNTDTVVDSIKVAVQPNSLTIDKHGNLWVLSDGGYTGFPNGQEYPTLTRINTTTFEKDYTYTLPDIEASPTKLVADGSGETLYFINGAWGTNLRMGGICKVSQLQSTTPSIKLIIPEDGRLFYGLGVDPANSDIYVSDALDYTQKGTVYRYSSKGELIHQFQTDIIPGYFCFK